MRSLQGFGEPIIPTQRGSELVGRKVGLSVMSTSEATSEWNAVVRQISHALSGPRCISLLGCLVAAVSSLFATFATESAARVGVTEALLRSVAVLLFSGVALWLANLTVRKKKATYSANPWFVVLLFVIVGALRPVVSAAVGVAVGGPFDVDLPRIGMAVFTTTTGLIILAVALDALDQSALTIARLKEHSEELLALRRERRDRIAFIRASLATSVIGPLIDRLMQIRQELMRFADGERPPSELDQLAGQVRDLSGNTARRAAHELASSDPDISGFEHEAVVIPDDRWAAFKDATLVSPYYPRTMAVLVFISYLLGSVRVYGPIGVAVSGILAVTLGVVLWLCQGLVRSRSVSSQPEVVRYLTVLLTFVIASALATMAAMLLVLASREEIPDFVSTGWAATFFAVLTMTVIISAGLSAIKSRQLMIRNLSDLTVELEREVDQQQVVLERLQQTLARQLHGDVQSRLSAIALRLDWLGNFHSNPDSGYTMTFGAQVALVGEELDRLALHLDKLEIKNDREKMAGVIDELQSSWGQVLNLDISIDDEVRERLKESGPASRTVTELMREGITNAVKHGGAKAVSIAIAADSGDWITVTIVDDGRGPNPGVPYGFGLSSLASDVDGLAVETNEQGGATLTGRLQLPQSVIASG